MSSLSAAQRRVIDLAKEDLVNAAEKLLKDSEVVPSRDFGHSQLRNLGAVAAETDSPEVVLNFIRYQIGRDVRRDDTKSKGWARKTNEVRLGERFLDALDSEKGPIRLALRKVKEEGSSNPHTDQLARMQLIRYFLGFATRYMKYLEVSNPSQETEEENP